MFRNKLSNQRRIALDGYWENQTDDEEAEEAARQAAEVRRYRSLPTTNSGRGLLHDLVSRASFVDGKLSDGDMIVAVECMMREIRLMLDEIAYLGKHTSKGREDDACLYARYRLNGMTECVGEIASLRYGGHVAHIMGQPYIRRRNFGSGKGMGVTKQQKQPRSASHSLQRCKEDRDGNAFAQEFGRALDRPLACVESRCLQCCGCRAMCLIRLFLYMYFHTLVLSFICFKADVPDVSDVVDHRWKVS